MGARSQSILLFLLLLLFNHLVMSDSDIMDGSTPGFPVLHCVLEFAQTHVH